MGPKYDMTGVFIRREKFGHRGTDTQRRWPCEDRGKDWRDASTSQGTARIANIIQKLEVARKGPSLGSWREHGHANSLVLNFWPPKL